MSGVDGAAILRALTPDKPSLEQHDELLACAERRFLRADEKLNAAAAEHNDARVALNGARGARAQFIADNPDPQLAMPL